MSKYPTPSMPYVQARYQFGRQTPTAIILRASMTTSDEGAALGVAQMWHRAPSVWKSGHYTVDAAKRFRCVPDNVIAGDPGSCEKGGIRIAVCAEPFSRTTFWHEEIHLPVLYKTAELVAELTLAYKIKPSYLELEALEKWSKKPRRRRGGIIVDTTDNFPYQTFLDEVMAQRALKMHI